MIKKLKNVKNNVLCFLNKSKTLINQKFVSNFLKLESKFSKNDAKNEGTHHENNLVEVERDVQLFIDKLRSLNDIANMGLDLEFDPNQ